MIATYDSYLISRLESFHSGFYSGSLGSSAGNSPAFPKTGCRPRCPQKRDRTLSGFLLSSALPTPICHIRALHRNLPEQHHKIIVLRKSFPTMQFVNIIGFIIDLKGSHNTCLPEPALFIVLFDTYAVLPAVRKKCYPARLFSARAEMIFVKGELRSFWVWI